jgi:hypothetical protein
MKKIRRILSIPFLLGMFFPIFFANSEEGHKMWFAALAYLFAFIGAGLAMDFKEFKVKPKHIGNFPESGIMPIINQTWMLFYISLVINLTVANLF